MDWYFSGEYQNTLDEKGRIAFPSKLRSVLGEEEVWITKGIGGDPALVIYPVDEWKKTIEEMQSKLSIYNRDTRKLFRMFIAPAQKLTMDKTGRIAIPQSLREYANLTKDCIFLGMNRIIELWDFETFNGYQKASEDDENIYMVFEKLTGE